MLEETNYFAEYEQLSIEKKAIEDKLKELKPFLLEKMEDDDQFDTVIGGKFTIKHRDKFTYSEEIQQAEKELKDRKKNEEIDGIAINNPTRYVQYNSAKKEA